MMSAMMNIQKNLVQKMVGAASAKRHTARRQPRSRSAPSSTTTTASMHPQRRATSTAASHRCQHPAQRFRPYQQFQLPYQRFQPPQHYYLQQVQPPQQQQQPLQQQSQEVRPPKRFANFYNRHSKLQYNFGPKTSWLTRSICVQRHL